MVLEISDVLVSKSNQWSHFKLGFKLLDVPSSFLWCHLIQIWQDESNSSSQELLKFLNDSLWTEEKSGGATYGTIITLIFPQGHWAERPVKPRLVQTHATTPEGGRCSFHWGCGSWWVKEIRLQGQLALQLLSVHPSEELLQKSSIFNPLCHYWASAWYLIVSWFWQL